MDEPKCDTCRFWEKVVMDRYPNTLLGHCRRNPAQIENGRFTEEGFYSARWPVTNVNDWCGEHQPIKKD